MRKLLPVVLLVLGLAQMAGDLLDQPALKGLAAATLLSPAPKVFSAAQGLETYSTRFFLEWRDATGKEHSRELTSACCAGLRGPYNRRNVYGAALAYGPVLAANPRTLPLLAAVMRHALEEPGVLWSELGLDPGPDATQIRVRYQPREGAELGELPTVLEVPLP